MEKNLTAAVTERLEKQAKEVQLTLEAEAQADEDAERNQVFADIGIDADATGWPDTHNTITYR